MLTILELIFCIALLLLIIHLCRRRCNRDQALRQPVRRTNDDLERFRQNHETRRRSGNNTTLYQSTTATNIEERRALVRKNLFSKNISGEKSVLDLAHLLAISRGDGMDEEMGCAPSNNVNDAENTTETLTGEIIVEPSAPSLESGAQEVVVVTAVKSQEQHEHDATTTTTSQNEETPGSIRNLITNLTQNVTRRLSHQHFYVEDKRLECSICLEEFNTGDCIGWAKDGGDPTPISNEGFADTGCDHIFHQECLISWLELHDDCPLCRRKVVHDNADVRFAGWEGM